MKHIAIYGDRTLNTMSHVKKYLSLSLCLQGKLVVMYNAIGDKAALP